MENKVNYFSQSMDDIVFDSRNKSYGAYAMRKFYEKHMLKALIISVSVFIFSMYTPSIANSLGLFEKEKEDKVDTTTIKLAEPPSIKPNEPPPPPPPPVQEVLRPTEKFMEMLAVEKEKVDEPPPPTIDELENKDIGKEKIEGEETDLPPPIIDEVGSGPVIDPNKVYTKVEQMPEFIGGEAAITEFLEENQQYPEEERSNEVGGIVVVRFVVNEDGRVSQVKVEKSSGYRALDAEAVRLVNLLPKFKPGRQNGVPVKVESKIPITFTVSE